MQDEYDMLLLMKQTACALGIVAWSVRIACSQSV
jgi:hypothetical protein